MIWGLRCEGYDVSDLYGVSPLCHQLSSPCATITPQCNKQHSLVKKFCPVGNLGSYLNIDLAVPRICFVSTKKYLTTYLFVKHRTVSY